MSTPAAIPWIQYNEDVVAENEPNGLSDVDNRPVKFILTQSDFAVTDVFPGFMARWTGTSSPEGVITAPVGHAFVDTTSAKLYIKMTVSGDTGWVAIGGNLTGNGSPEGAVTAAVGQIYEQRDAASSVGSIWIKRSGTGNTGWRQMVGAFAGTSGTDSIEIGRFATGGASANNAIAFGTAAAAGGAGSIAIGAGASIGAFTNGIAVGTSATVGGNDGIAIGNAATTAAASQISIGTGSIPSSAGASVVIGTSLTLTGMGTNNVVIGPTITSGSGASNVAIGFNLTLGTQSGCVLIGAGASLSGGSGVAIAGSCTTGGSNPCVAIQATISGTGTTTGNTVCIGGAVTLNSGCTAVGVTTSVSAVGGVAVGFGASVAATVGIAIGSGAGVASTHINSISIGDGDTWQQQMVNIGFNNTLSGITMMAVGHGMDTKSSPASLLFRLTNGSGTDNAAGNLTMQPGLSTGNAAEGMFKVQTGDAGASGTTLQTATVKFVVGRTVAIGTTLDTNAALKITLSANCSIIATNGRSLFGTATLNTGNTGGITVDQAALDDEILSFKSSDVAHGITSVTETDVYGAFRKSDSNLGGIRLDGYTEDVRALDFRADVTAVDATKSAAGNGCLNIRGSLKSGTTITSLTANSNIICVQDHTTTRFILDSDGDSHQDVGTAWTNFDEHDDVALLNRLSAHVSRRDDPLRQSFGRWLQESRDDLQRLKLVTFNDDGHHFVNMSRLSMLHTGAIRQLGAKLDKIEVMLQRLLPSET